MATLEQAVDAESNFTFAVAQARESYKSFLLSSGYKLVDYSDYDAEYRYWVHPDYYETALKAKEHWDLSLDTMCELLGVETLPDGAVIKDFV